MRVGVPREVKVHENRVGLTPDSVAELTTGGADVIVQAGAGAGVGFADDDYRRAGARIGSIQEAFAADLVVKVKARMRTAAPGTDGVHLPASRRRQTPGTGADGVRRHGHCL